MAHNPHPYLRTPLAPSRPRMFASTPAKVLWTLVPVVTLGLALAVPFVVATAKGVVKLWLAAAYVMAEITVFSLGLVISPTDDEGSAVPRFLLTLLIITSATHTALLDHEKVRLAK
ncbi:hypothetical protein [Streptomyces sp. enrichment culture]|uniref:hypothetical protein n=1 Tax=Streptomyces sp. enrichment culture TaxID=1795815 RepID=UPI003F55529C